VVAMVECSSHREAEITPGFSLLLLSYRVGVAAASVSWEAVTTQVPAQ
jgi:hypothetical protein